MKVIISTLPDLPLYDYKSDFAITVIVQDTVWLKHLYIKLYFWFSLNIWAN